MSKEHCGKCPASLLLGGQGVRWHDVKGEVRWTKGRSGSAGQVGRNVLRRQSVNHDGRGMRLREGRQWTKRVKEKRERKDEGTIC